MCRILLLRTHFLCELGETPQVLTANLIQKHTLGACRDGGRSGCSGGQGRVGGWAAPGPQAPARLTLGKGREAEPGRWPVQGDPSRLSRPGPGARPHLSGLLTTACRSLKRRPWFITALPQALRPLPAPAPRRGPWGWLGWQLQGLWTAVNHHRLKAWGPAHAERGTPHPELLSGGVMALPAPRQLPFP